MCGYTRSQSLTIVCYSMAKSFPNTIAILGTRYKIILTNSLEDAGEMDGDLKEISISVSTGNNMETLLHEFFHAVFHETGLYCTSIDDDLEEVICQSFARALLQVFKIELATK